MDSSGAVLIVVIGIGLFLLKLPYLLALVGTFNRRYHTYRDANGTLTAYRANAGFCAWYFPYVAGPMRGHWLPLWIFLGAMVLDFIFFGTGADLGDFFRGIDKIIPKTPQLITENPQPGFMYAVQGAKYAGLLGGLGQFISMIVCGVGRGARIERWGSARGLTRVTSEPIWALTADAAVASQLASEDSSVNQQVQSTGTAAAPNRPHN